MSRTIALGAALLACAIAAPAAAQSASENDRDDIPARNDSSMEKTLERAERDRMDARADQRLSRPALENWAGCLAQRNPGEATRLLTMDFTSKAYQNGMRMLSMEDRDCVQFRGTLRSSGLLFAGELAEGLLERDSAALPGALARAASAPATHSFSFTDRIAICTVRSAPSDVAALFATARDSAQETAALNGLSVAMGLCAKAADAKKPLSINPAGLRAMLATAAFRSVESSKAS